MANIGLSHPLILFFLIASPPLLLLIHGGPAADFHQWCHRTTHEGTCLFVILSDPRDYLKTSPNGFCTIINQKARQVVTSAIQKVNDLLASSKLPPFEFKLLQRCSDVYYSAIESITDLNFTDLNHETYPKLNTIFRQIYDHVYQCEIAFKPPNLSPMEVEDRNIMKLSEILAQILSLNECNQTSSCLQK